MKRTKSNITFCIALLITGAISFPADPSNPKTLEFNSLNAYFKYAKKKPDDTSSTCIVNNDEFGTSFFMAPPGGYEELKPHNRIPNSSSKAETNCLNQSNNNNNE